MLPRGIPDYVSPDMSLGEMLDSWKVSHGLPNFLRYKGNATETQQSPSVLSAAFLVRLVGAGVCNVGHVLSFDLKVNTQKLLGGMSIGSTTLEICLAVSTNVILNTCIPYHPDSSCLAIYPKEMHTSTYIHRYKNVHSSTI